MSETMALSGREPWDGTGRALGLKGNVIAIEGRIVTMVNVLAALMHDRPYKQVWPMDEALQKIHRLRGSHFAPNVVEASLSLHGYLLRDGQRDELSRPENKWEPK